MAESPLDEFSPSVINPETGVMTAGTAEFYIPATTSLLERRPRTLKHGDMFGVFNPYGDVVFAEHTPEGLFYRDTRYLSHVEVLLNGRRPLLLSSTIQDDNALLAVDLTNPDIYDNDRLILPRDTISINRSKFLWQGGCYERVAIRNFGNQSYDVRLTIRFRADFADLFEVRGLKRPKRGALHPPEVAEETVRLSYTGLDGKDRQTLVKFDPAPSRLHSGVAEYALTLEPGRRSVLFMVVQSEPEDGMLESGRRQFLHGLRETRRAMRKQAEQVAKIRTSNTLFNGVLNRAVNDLSILTSETRLGRYPYAGIPWFSTPFGRDGIITAFHMLWVDPSLARGVLHYLADTQAKREDPYADAEPGKILHETRGGEMAKLREVPFGLYYGSVDSTPLFVMLAAAYYTRTGDLESIRNLWPNIVAALEWIDRYGDRDGDGFVEYGRRTSEGLLNQGWKDSHDSVFHTDGLDASQPIALCEVQGYVYDAKWSAARLASMLGEFALANKLEREAIDLKARFNEAFWCDELGTYALALDGDKKPCRVRSSNAGHALFTGIATPERADQLTKQLMDSNSFSGWGIRTIPVGETRYNPMSYHNGSVWPHDNALIGLGMARYNIKEPILRLFGGLVDAAMSMDLQRLPELFCGFPRRHGSSPTLYPVACMPQAWASSTIFALLQACLGLSFRPEFNEIRFDSPRLPEFLENVCLHGLKVGTGQVDVQLRRHGEDVAVTVLERRGAVQVVTVS